MANIYEVTGSILEIQQLIESGSEGLEDTLESLEMALEEKLEGYAMVIKNIESDAAGIKAEESRLAERRKSMENAIKRMKENMQYSMVATGQLKVKGEKFNFTVQKNPPSLKVLDEDLIPQNFVTVQEVKNIDKKAILAELKNGTEIDGVEISQGESIRIR
ncbi:siphovirus Gp157 family protein [Solibacillus cecembensis]|uniref:siphovirus Gp157 family protein n=1 Tax=Solibacillus cecembensis TaxID=459347 RepID=UPI003D077A8A